MKIEELRNLSKEDLVVKLAALKEEMSKLTYLRIAGQVDKPHKFKEVRKSIAQINTLLNEKEPSEKK